MPATAPRRKPVLPLTPAQQLLVEANTGLIGWAMQRWASDAKGEDYEEASAFLLEGLVRAAQLFDPAYLVKGKPVRFGTYAGYWLFQAVQKWRGDRTRRRSVGSVSLDLESCGDEGNVWSLQQEAQEDELGFLSVENREVVELWRRALPKRLWRTLWQRVALGKTLAEVAKKERVSREAIRQRVKKAVAILKQLEGVSCD